LNAHPALSPDDWSPGFAKRADHFERVSHAARTWCWQPGQYVSRVCAAIAKGTPELTDGQRAVLALYAEHLNQDRLETNQAFVWISIGLTGELLGCTDREVRRRNRALEDQGFLIRDYNRANRPAGQEAFNLAPLVARLDELEGVYAVVRQALKDRRAAYLEGMLTERSAQEDGTDRPEQSNSNGVDSVTGSVAPLARSRFARRRATPAEDPAASPTNRQTHAPRPAQNGLARGGRVCAGENSAASGALDRLRQELTAALQACPELSGCVSAQIIENPLCATPEDAAKIADAAEALLPQTDRNNGDTALWGFRRHGARIAVMLAVALKDPNVQNPSKYFGALATWDTSRSLDLRLNLARLLRDPGRVPPQPPSPPIGETIVANTALTGPGSDDPVWVAIDAEIRKSVREGPYGSWFGRLGFHGIEDGVMALSAPGHTAADRLRAAYLGDIRAAAEAAGYPVEQVLLSVRSTSPEPTRREPRRPGSRT